MEVAFRLASGSISRKICCQIFFFLVLSRTTVQGNKIRTRGYSKSLVGGFGDGLLHKAEPMVLKEGEGIIVFNSTSSLGYCG